MLSIKFLSFVALLLWKVNASTLQLQPKYKYMKFGGGGIYFWWQAGCGLFLQEQCKKNGQLPIVGASAGALSATLLATGADFEKAAEIAIRQATENKLWDKPQGLAGVWGRLVKEWLTELIPENITPEDLTKLYITATPVPNLLKGPVLLSNFQSKSQLIDACLASVHIPLFMDGKLTADYNKQNFIDGSFWAFVNKRAFKEPLPPSLVSQVGTANAQLIQASLHSSQQAIPEPPFTLGGGGGKKGDLKPDEVFVVDWHRDLKFREKAKNHFTDLITADGVYEMMDYGYQYMKRQYESGSVPTSY